MENKTVGRVHGTEMEWGVCVPSSTGKLNLVQAQALQHAVNRKLETIDHVGRPSDCFLSNGSRLYSDPTYYKETATAEDTEFIGTTANEIAAENIMRSIVDIARHDEAGDPTNLINAIINKRVVDENGATWGYHESYSIDKNSKLNSTGLALMGVHLATRGVLFGAGSLSASGTYRTTQKAGFSSDDFSGNSTRCKPVVNLRDESHSTVSKRLHVISGDPQMSPWATRMNLGTTSIVARLQEHGVLLPEVRFAKPLDAIARQVGTDVFARTGLPIENGRSLTALEVQAKLAIAGRKLAKTTPFTADELWTLDEWQQVCAEMQADIKLVANKVVWVLKRQVLLGHQEKHGIPWTSPQLRAVDRLWDDLSDKGIGRKLRETTWAEWMPPEDLIEARGTQPPTTTRAVLRSAFIKKFSRQDKATVDWNTFKPPHEVYSTRMDDEYATSHRKLEQLLQKESPNQAA
jgi:proteasome accessory factor A